MGKALLILAFVLVALSVGVVANAQPTTIQPLGNGLIMNTPSQIPTTVQPFGNDAIMNTPGQMPTTSQPFGNGMIMDTHGQTPTTNTRGRPSVVCTPLVTGVSCNF
jgi:hypothetical protein